jgi:hypothetical protein
MTTLTIAEVLDALSQSVPEEGEEIPPHTYSGTEIREALGVGYVGFKRAMTAWLKAGKVEVVQIRKRAMDGRLGRTRAYRFIV